ncbi:MAG: hypothetical protein K0R54_2569 [Clostridiaceae bacterium]|jgi:hypothetical protein|nr:hypothetical protein [Clostridiaceae bacterium]
MKEQFNKLLIKAVWIAIVLFTIRCLFSLESIKGSFSVYNFIGFAGEAIGITTIITTVYERWGWKLNPLEDTPVLCRNYIGTMLTSYDNIEREARLEVKQTLLSTNIILISGESKSKSISSSIDSVLGEKQLTYCYLNTPTAAVRDRSEIHYGTAMLCIENPKEITGQYFTDRKTAGDMYFYSQEYTTSNMRKQIV